MMMMMIKMNYRDDDDMMMMTFDRGQPSFFPRKLPCYLVAIAQQLNLINCKLKFQVKNPMRKSNMSLEQCKCRSCAFRTRFCKTERQFADSWNRGIEMESKVIVGKLGGSK